jgi:hypothetical protein
MLSRASLNVLIPSEPSRAWSSIVDTASELKKGRGMAGRCLDLCEKNNGDVGDAGPTEQPVAQGLRPILLSGSLILYRGL